MPAILSYNCKSLAQKKSVCYMAAGWVFISETGRLVGHRAVSIKRAGRHVFVAPPTYSPVARGAICLCADSSVRPSSSISRCAAHVVRIAAVPATLGAKGDKRNAEDEEDDQGDDAHLGWRKPAQHIDRP